MAEQMDVSKMTLNEFRDAVSKNKDDVMGIRKLAFLQKKSYKEAVEGLYELIIALEQDKVNKNDGSEAPIAQTVKLGNDMGFRWNAGPFVVSGSVSVSGDAVTINASIQIDVMGHKFGGLTVSRTIRFGGVSTIKLKFGVFAVSVVVRISHVQNNAFYVTLIIQADTHIFIPIEGPTYTHTFGPIPVSLFQQLDVAEMTLYQFRDAVAKNEKDVMGIRKLAFLQNISYNEAVKGLYELIVALEDDKVNKNDGLEAADTDTVKFGDDVGFRWQEGPFDVYFSVSFKSDKEQTGAYKIRRRPKDDSVDAVVIKGQIKIDLMGYQSVSSFSRTIRLGASDNIEFMNTGRVTASADVAVSKASRDQIYITFGIEATVHLLFYNKTFNLGSKKFGPISLP